MGALYKYAVKNLNKSSSDNNMNLSTPEASLTMKSEAQPSQQQADLTPLAVESNNMGMAPKGQTDANNTGINDYSNIGKVGTTPGYTDLWQQQSVQTTQPQFQPWNVNGQSPAAPAIPSMPKQSMSVGQLAAAALGAGTVAYGGKKIYDYKKDATDRAKHTAMTRIPRALLAAVATGALGYKLNDSARNYITRGNAATGSMAAMRSNVRNASRYGRKYSSNELDLIKHAMSTGRLAQLIGLGATGTTLAALPFAKRYIDKKAQDAVDAKTRFWTPGAAVAGLGLGYMASDIPRIYSARKRVKAYDDYKASYNTLMGS